MAEEDGVIEYADGTRIAALISGEVDFVLDPPLQDVNRLRSNAAVRILEGPLAPVPCVSVMAYEKCPECLDEQTCGIRLVMKDVRDAIAEILDHTSLHDMLQRSEDEARKLQGVVDFQI